MDNHQQRDSDPAQDFAPPRQRPIRMFGREFQLPQSRIMRIVIGVVLVFCGMLGFLPVLGFWMIPLGLFILSYDIARVRRWRRRAEVWWAGKRRRKPGT